MTLLWLLLGIAVIVGIARYNEDDPLFWKLFVCFIGAFAAACVALNLLKDSKQSNDDLQQVNPTQELVMASFPHAEMCCSLQEVALSTPFDVKHQNPVGKVIPAPVKVVSTHSKVSAVARDQPPNISFFDTS